MTKICDCPVAAALTNIPLDECPEDFGQIQKMIFQRIYSSGSTKNKFVVATANPNVLASWTPLLAAVDGTKVVQSPFLSNPENEPGAAREYGGGNATLGGIPLILGAEPSTFVAQILQSKQPTIEALKSYPCENVGVFFVDEYGRMGMLADDVDTPTEYYPIPIKSLFIGDKGFGGIENPDINTLSFYLKRNWSDKFAIVAPTNFDALNDLATP